MKEGGTGRKITYARVTPHPSTSPKTKSQVRFTPLPQSLIRLIEPSYRVEVLRAPRHVARFEELDRAFVGAVLVRSAGGGSPSAADDPRLPIPIEEETLVALK